MIGRAHLLLLLALAALLAGCPEPDPGIDASPDRGPGDAAREAVRLGDLTIPSDLPPASVCQAACLARGLHLCLFDAAVGRCVECTADTHCVSNPGALGPRCDVTTRRCVCDGDADCAKNLRGPICDAVKKICTCVTSAQCKGPFPVCGGSGDARTCVRPCVKDADCKDPGAPRCRVSSGRCVACLEDDHCVGHPEGTRCDDGRCGCSQDSHCELASAWGSHCVGVGQQRRCGCVNHSDCPVNRHGPVCNVEIQRCTCTSGYLCTISPHTTCARPHAGAAYRQCRRPCTSDGDCASIPGLPRCVKGQCAQCTTKLDCAPATPHCDTKNHCAQCLTDAHCSVDAPLCDTSRGRCAQCLSHGDCSNSLDGGTCLEGSCGCTSHSDCKGMTWGSTCHPVLRRCSCLSDAGCKGVASGPTCDHTLHKCVCKTAGQCKAPNVQCALPYLGAAYRHCQPSCKADADCTGKPGLARCDLKSGVCLPCLTDADCAGRPFAKICDVSTAVMGCVQCRQDSHCGAASLGAKCSSSEGVCYCAADAQCATNLNGNRCHLSLQICSCVKDADCPKGRTCTGSHKGLGKLLCK